MKECSAKFTANTLAQQLCLELTVATDKIAMCENSYLISMDLLDFPTYYKYQCLLTEAIAVSAEAATCLLLPTTAQKERCLYDYEKGQRMTLLGNMYQHAGESPSVQALEPYIYDSLFTNEQIEDFLCN